ncbi:major histocompatibility complex class I-related gene protein-like [Salminus brasiliensis]|uniref:major histocompatibility complex class I-related gene protein-like n=1 Tax=Salminus brasiliensis TaxID=930266 RepID=UPI003B83762C
MKLLFLLLLWVSNTAAEIYIYCVKYTAAAGIAGLPEFTATSFLHEKQLDYYDSKDHTLLPRQEWAKRALGESYWQRTTQLRFSESVQLQKQLSSAMESSGHREGVHTFQRMYGCLWDEGTDHSEGFDVYGYDGENFLSLDLNSRSFTALIPQAKSMAQKWNQNKTQLESLRLYYTLGCGAWVKTFFFKSHGQDQHWGLQIDLFSLSLCSVLPGITHYLKRSFPQAVMCHAEQLSSKTVQMSWQRNEKDFDLDDFVIIGDTLPNGDGSFQKTIYLFVWFEDLIKNQYKCTLEYRSLTGQSLLKISQDTVLQFNYGTRSHHRANHSKWGNYDEDDHNGEDFDEDEDYEEDYDEEDYDDHVWQRPHLHRKKF